MTDFPNPGRVFLTVGFGLKGGIGNIDLVCDLQVPWFAEDRFQFNPIGCIFRAWNDLELQMPGGVVVFIHYIFVSLVIRFLPKIKVSDCGCSL